ncbi:MAG: thioredoxin family protein [Nannocystaceae bacterium]|nr:thioredoxin family protein [Nannocystaceae bacterium]
MTRPHALAALATLLLMPMLGCDRSGGEAGKAAPPAAGPSTASAATPTTAPPLATAVLGQPAPDFTLTDTEGKTVRLSDHKGKLVVLEWWNPGCPFVKYAHGEQGPLRTMAAEQMAQGVVWFAINSGAPGKQGAGADASREGASGFGMGHPVLIDEAGTVGRAYEARKTPHVFLIDDKGVLVYRGAIDNAPIGEVDGGGAYVNHLAAALADVRAGKPVATAQTDAYGCSVKYAS